MGEEKKSSSNFQVVNIADAQKKLARAKKKMSSGLDLTDPLPLHKILSSIADIMLGDPILPGFTEIPLAFEAGARVGNFCFINGALAFHDHRARTVCEVADKSASSLWEMIFEQTLSEAAGGGHSIYLENLTNSLRNHHELAERCLLRARAIGLDYDSVRPVGELSYPGICRQRLAFDIESLGLDAAMHQAPTWRSLFGRLSDPKIVAQFLYEVFSCQGNIKQVLWLHGPSDAGKSTLAAVVGAALARDATATIEGEIAFGSGRRFLVESIYDKILVNLDDCTGNVINMPGFKSLTGSRQQTMDRKFQRPVTVNLQCRFMATSNSRPEYRLDDKTEAVAQANRILEVGISHATETVRPDQYDRWIAALGKEIHPILCAGKRLWEEQYIHSKRQTDILGQLANTFSFCNMSDFLSDFAVDKYAKLELKKLRMYVQMRVGNNDREYNKLKNLLIETFGCKEVREGNTRYMAGIRLI